MKELEYIKKHFPNFDLKIAKEKLEKGLPVQYVVGHVDFYGNKILVNKDVLIPRFETEELVSKTIRYLKNNFKEPFKIVDLGTGSACIAITLKKHFPNSIVKAVEISPKALKVAKKNAILNKVKIKFYLGDMLKPLNDKFDCIISNPPYISYDEEIMDIVKNNEPHIALYAKNNGLEYYYAILNNISQYLTTKYLIALEIGHTQATEIIKIIKEKLPNSKIEVEKDLQKKERFIFISNF